MRNVIIAATLLAISASAAADTGQALALADPGFQSSLLGRPSDLPAAIPLFKANYSYPSSAPDVASEQWMVLDPRVEGDRPAYYQAVLQYGIRAFKGSIQKGCPETAPDWYHVPWLTFSFGTSSENLAAGRIGAGREPVCGLTQERSAPRGFLHVNQTASVQDWAVGMMNAQGGVTLGRVWANHGTPDLSNTKFPNGTFIIKYLFTEASVAQVPYLAGAPEWLANVYTDTNPGTTTRQTKTMRLVQIDFGIRDERMNAQSGWIYGTFLFYNDSGNAVADWTTKVIPVGLMWGNDPQKSTAAQFQEQALNPSVATLRDQGKLFDLSRRTEFGWQDRVNGPIDNPVSSCLSCHSTAQVHPDQAIKHFITPSVDGNDPGDAIKRLWFRNIPAGDTFTFSPAQLPKVNQGAPSSARATWTTALMAKFVSTDYSLQERMAIENARFYALQSAIHVINLQGGAMAKSLAINKSAAYKKFLKDAETESKRIERDGRPP